MSRVNAAESCSAVFILNFEHISHVLEKLYINFFLIH